MDRLDGMRAFVAVVAAGSFAGAAERLGLSPQLVSKYVRALEDRLGARLLNRTTRRLSLTELGRAYHQRCAPLLDEIDDLDASAQDQNRAPGGKLTVSAPTTFGEHYLADALGAFLAAYPTISVELRLSDRFVGLVEEGFDLAVRIGDLPDSSLIARRLAPARVVACAAPDYLRRAGRPATPEDLAGHACVIDTNIRTPGAWPFVVDGARRLVRVEGRIRVDSAAASRRLALAGAGVALCPTYLVGPDIRDGRLEVLLAEYEPPPRGLYAVYVENRHLTAKVRRFVDFLAETFAGAPWERF